MAIEVAPSSKDWVEPSEQLAKGPANGRSAGELLDLVAKISGFRLRDFNARAVAEALVPFCLLYTSDAADE